MSKNKKTSKTEGVRFTVITIVYNDVKNIEKTILSVLNQKYQNFEYIIIDGGSTDGTVDIIKKYQKSIDDWVSEKDGGIYPAMNKGISLAKGEIINMLNSGDYYIDSHVLDRVAREFYKEDISFLLGLGKFIDEKDKTIHKGGKLYTTSLKATIFSSICHQSFFYKKSLHDKFGLYDTRYKICADGHFMYRLYHNKAIRRKLLNEVLVVRRRSGVSKTPNSVLEHKKMYDEVFGKRLIHNLLYLKYLLIKSKWGRYLHEGYLSIKSIIK